MSKPRLLDLFCGAGGAGMGYARAGFEVVGVDIRPQRSYPFTFVQGDALAFLERNGQHFDAIHASPPCQRWSSNTPCTGNPDDHPDFIAPVRKLLLAIGAPYVIENVPRAPLIKPMLLCGVERGLRLEPNFVLRRHRIFESNINLWSRGCGCYRGDGVTLGVYGGGTSTARRNNKGGGRPYKGTAEQRKAIMGMPWCANSHEVNEAIPPAYTEWIGRQLLDALRVAA